jgi:hypothetical protein
MRMKLAYEEDNEEVEEEHLVAADPEGHEQGQVKVHEIHPKGFVMLPELNLHEFEVCGLACGDEDLPWGELPPEEKRPLEIF